MSWTAANASLQRPQLEREAQALVITMADRPERLQRFRQDNPSWALPIQTQFGIHGRDHWPWIQRSNLIQNDCFATWSQGAIGCALSHLLCWRTCLKTNRTTFVFEDDAILSRDWLKITSQLVEELQGNFDILLLGWNLDSALRASCFEGIESISLFEPAYPNEAEIRAVVNSQTSRKLLRLKHGFGLPGYLISPSGARKLLQHCTPLRREPIALGRGIPAIIANHIDCLLNSCYQNFNSYAIDPPIALAYNDQATSSTKTISNKTTEKTPMEFGD